MYRAPVPRELRLTALDPRFGASPVVRPDSPCGGISCGGVRIHHQAWRTRGRRPAYAPVLRPDSACWVSPAGSPDPPSGVANPRPSCGAPSVTSVVSPGPPSSRPMKGASQHGYPQGTRPHVPGVRRARGGRNELLRATRLAHRLGTARTGAPRYTTICSSRRTLNRY